MSSAKGRCSVCAKTNGYICLSIFDTHCSPTGEVVVLSGTPIATPHVTVPKTLVSSLGEPTKITDPHHPDFDPFDFRFENYFPDQETYITRLYYAVGEICRRHPHLDQLDKVLVDLAGAQKYVDPVHKPIQYVYLYPPLPEEIDPASREAKNVRASRSENDLLHYKDRSWPDIDIRVGVSRSDPNVVTTCYVNGRGVYAWDKDLHPDFKPH